MKLNDMRYGVRIAVSLRLASGLLLRSGATGEFADSVIERTPDDDLHINGYVWASLMRRALERVAGMDDLAAEIGLFPEDKLDTSTLWCEDSMVSLPRTDIRPGINVNRLWGVNKTGGLFSDELVPAGLQLTMQATWFSPDKDKANHIKQAIKNALWVIQQKIETIGGGWSYGFGRLQVLGISVDVLELADSEQRKKLWSFPEPEPVAENERISWKPTNICKPWTHLRVEAFIPSGQLLAVAGRILPLQQIATLGDVQMPDTFIFRGSVFDATGKSHEQSIIPGKTLRQALFAVPIERKLRSKGEDICETPAEYCTCAKCCTYRDDNPTQKKIVRCPQCTCQRCQWFGATDRRGLIAVEDAIIPDTDMENIILNRVQLCEHTMQNVQLFSGEYLSRATFAIDVLIDYRDQDLKTGGKELLQEVNQILTEMQADNAPAGWYRVGFTSTCTGALQTASKPEQTNFGC